MSRPDWPDDRVTRWSRRALGWAARIVPGHLRLDRRLEWEAELWQLRAYGGSSAEVAHFVVGAWLDAIWERREGWRM